MSKYFVFKGEDQPYYRAYGVSNFLEPQVDDPRCVWRGDDYNKALEIAKKMNQEQRPLAVKQKKLFNKEQEK